MKLIEFLENYIKYVYDVTVAYPENIVQSEKILLKEGNFPRSAHFDFHKIEIEEVPKDKVMKRKWVSYCISNLKLIAFLRYVLVRSQKIV